MADPNYLIGFGQRLVKPISLKQGGGPKHYPYSFEEARTRLAPEWVRLSKRIRSLPDLACPGGTAVISMTLHPAFLARSYYPSNLLRDLGLRPVGSRARPMPIDSLPSKRTGVGKPHTAPELFLAGLRKSIRRFSEELPHWYPDAAARDDFRKIQEVRALDSSRLKSFPDGDDEPPLEVVLHASESDADDYVLAGFEAYAQDLGIRVDLGQRIHAGGLCFLPMRAPCELLEKLTDFAFVRAVRRMPKLSLNESILRTASRSGTFQVRLPKKDAINPDVRVAIFDGGLPPKSDVSRWVRARDAVGVGAPRGAYQEHGLAVTSALLFGPLEDGQDAPVPYSNVEHWRVLDRDTHGDDFELVAVLRRILDVLHQRKYDVVCLSIGPALPIEDDDVHVWTSALDTYLANANLVLVAACGNTGDDDWDSGNARIQPCSDAVNGVGVGAADSRRRKWVRAPYSSIGPGRSPGFVKPDLVAFGGSDSEPFWLLDPRRPGFTAAKMGTSYAAPNAARTGIGMKAHFGGQLTAAAVKALMVHHSMRGKNHQREVGWGRMPPEVDRLVICPEGEVSVLFQGMLEPSQFIRFPIPVPKDPLRSEVEIRATFCFFSPVDPEDPLNYTRAGLGITFRPSTKGHPGYNDDGKPRGAHPSDRFFLAKAYYSTELEHRRDAHKWETVLRAARSFAARTLDEPVFDVEHHARLHGGPAGRRADISYALVVSLSSDDEPDLYNRILAAYPNRLEILRPAIEVPITVRR
jgi:hypothetical protein